MDNLFCFVKQQLACEKNLISNVYEILQLMNSEFARELLDKQQGDFMITYYFQRQARIKEFNKVSDEMIENIYKYRNYNYAMQNQFDKIMQSITMCKSLDNVKEENNFQPSEILDIGIMFKFLELDWFKRNNMLKNLSQVNIQTSLSEKQKFQKNQMMESNQNLNNLHQTYLQNELSQELKLYSNLNFMSQENFNQIKEREKPLLIQDETIRQEDLQQDQNDQRLNYNLTKEDIEAMINQKSLKNQEYFQVFKKAWNFKDINESYMNDIFEQSIFHNALSQEQIRLIKKYEKSITKSRNKFKDHQKQKFLNQDQNININNEDDNQHSNMQKEIQLQQVKENLGIINQNEFIQNNCNKQKKQRGGYRGRRKDQNNKNSQEQKSENADLELNHQEEKQQINEIKDSFDNQKIIKCEIETQLSQIREITLQKQQEIGQQNNIEIIANLERREDANQEIDFRNQEMQEVSQNTIKSEKVNQFKQTLKNYFKNIIQENEVIEEENHTNAEKINIQKLRDQIEMSSYQFHPNHINMITNHYQQEDQQIKQEQNQRQNQSDSQNSNQDTYQPLNSPQFEQFQNNKQENIIEEHSYYQQQLTQQQQQEQQVQNSLSCLQQLNNHFTLNEEYENDQQLMAEEEDFSKENENQDIQQFESNQNMYNNLQQMNLDDFEINSHQINIQEQIFQNATLNYNNQDLEQQSQQKKILNNDHFQIDQIDNLDKKVPCQFLKNQQEEEVELEQCNVKQKFEERDMQNNKEIEQQKFEHIFNENQELNSKDLYCDINLEEEENSILMNLISKEKVIKSMSPQQDQQNPLTKPSLKVKDISECSNIPEISQSLKASPVNLKLVDLYELKLINNLSSKNEKSDDEELETKTNQSKKLSSSSKIKNEQKDKKKKKIGKTFKELSQEEIQIIKNADKKDASTLAKRLGMSYQTMRKVILKVQGSL